MGVLALWLLPAIDYHHFPRARRCSAPYHRFCGGSSSSTAARFCCRSWTRRCFSPVCEKKLWSCGEAAQHQTGRRPTHCLTRSSGSHHIPPKWAASNFRFLNPAGRFLVLATKAFFAFSSSAKVDAHSARATSSVASAASARASAARGARSASSALSRGARRAASRARPWGERQRGHRIGGEQLSVG